MQHETSDGTAHDAQGRAASQRPWCSSHTLDRCAAPLRDSPFLYGSPTTTARSTNQERNPSPGQLHVPILWSNGYANDNRPRPSEAFGRNTRVGKRGDGVPGVQSPQGWTYAHASPHAAFAPTLRTAAYGDLPLWRIPKRQSGMACLHRRVVRIRIIPPRSGKCLPRRCCWQGR